jgi:hypothetical protein
MTDEMKGVFLYLHKEIDHIKKIKHVEAIDITSSYGGDGERKTLNVPIQSNWVDIGNGISIIIEKDKDENRKDDFQSFEVVLSLKSIVHAYGVIEEFVNKCKADYADYIRFGTATQLCHTYKCMNDDGHVLFDSAPFLSSKSFDNMLFEGKEELVQRIQMFESDEGVKRSNKIGKHHAFGMLLHGEPGCGKTSCIKAVARLTGRHIVVIQMDTILTKDYDKGMDILKSIMLSPKIGDIDVPQAKRLYVFEEADTWQDIMKQRVSSSRRPLKEETDHTHIKRTGEMQAGKTAPDASATTTLVNMLVNSLDQSKSSGEHMLGAFLELMDGLVEMPGRICIMTTNHPNKLDPALMRPGRFGDAIIEFKRFTRKHVEKMYAMWFDEPLPEHVANKLRDYTWTQAELGQLFERTDHAEVLNKLCVHKI